MTFGQLAWAWTGVVGAILKQASATAENDAKADRAIIVFITF
ncbi:hypothetical protein NSP_15200 [Nodularia spumigena CCY9414]|nr:hypothetical protein NSP_15200 [Nodularia spumigena CCY9414]